AESTSSGCENCRRASSANSNAIVCNRAGRHRLRINKSLQRYNVSRVRAGDRLNIVLLQSWQRYAVAVIVGSPRGWSCVGISDNVASAAHGAKGLVGVLDEVTKAVVKTRNAAGQVLEASETVEAAASRLQRGIEGFLGRVAV